VIYNANIATPANRAKTNLKRTVLNVTRGLVYRVEFSFPSGPAGLMGVAVFDGLFQLWPSTVGEFFASDGETIAFDDMYLKEAAPYQFDIYTYNTDDTYPHSVAVRIGLVSKEVFLARFMPTKSYDYLADLMRKMEAERAELAAIQRELIAETPYEWLAKQLEEGE